jgi:hypothetical protein
VRHARPHRMAVIVIRLDRAPIVARWRRRRAELPTPDRLVPRGSREPKSAAASVAVIPGIVVCLDGKPIVADSHVVTIGEGRATGVARTQRACRQSFSSVGRARGSGR